MPSSLVEGGPMAGRYARVAARWGPFLRAIGTSEGRGRSRQRKPPLLDVDRGRGGRRGTVRRWGWSGRGKVGGRRPSGEPARQALCGNGPACQPVVVHTRAEGVSSTNAPPAHDADTGQRAAGPD